MGLTATLECFSGELGRTCHCVAVDTAVQLDGRGLGGHRGVPVLHRPMITVEQGQKTPVELEKMGIHQNPENA